MGCSRDSSKVHHCSSVLLERNTGQISHEGLKSELQPAISCLLLWYLDILLYSIMYDCQLVKLVFFSTFNRHWKDQQAFGLLFIKWRGLRENC